MKIKADFVTNSSSCSFIFVGWKLDQTLENARILGEVLDIDISEGQDTIDILRGIEKYRNLFIYFGDDEETGLESEKIYIGYHTRIDDEDPTSEDAAIVDIINNKRLVKALGIKNIRVITGTTVC